MGKAEKKPVAEASDSRSLLEKWVAKQERMAATPDVADRQRAWIEVRARAKREQANKNPRARAKRKRMDERLKEGSDD